MDGRTDGQGKNIWPSDYRQAGHKKKKKKNGGKKEKKESLSKEALTAEYMKNLTADFPSILCFMLASISFSSGPVNGTNEVSLIFFFKIRGPVNGTNGFSVILSILFFIHVYLIQPRLKPNSYLL